MSTLSIFLENKENKIWNITKRTIVDLPFCYPTGTELTKFILNLSLFWLIETIFVHRAKTDDAASKI